MKSAVFFVFGVFIGAALLVLYELALYQRSSRGSTGLADPLHHGCHNWTLLPNTNAPNSRAAANVNTVESCQLLCLRTLDCNGIDWIGADAAASGPTGGPRCALSGTTWSSGLNKGSAPGTTHFALERVACVPMTSKDEGQGQVQGQGQKLDVVPERCTARWNASRDTQAFGGHAHSSRTISDCQKACLLYNGCTGIDWTSDTADFHQCWFTGTWITGWNRGSAPGVTHFDIVSNNCKSADKV